MPRTLMPGAARNASRIQGEYWPRCRRCFWPAISSVTESLPARGTMRNGSAIALRPSTSSLTGPTSDPSRCWPERRSGQRLPPSGARPSGRVLNSVKLPCVPRKSGVHIADSKRPLNSSGGKVMGTRRTVLPMECSPRIFQKVWLLRSMSTVGRQSGMRRRPIRRARRAGRTRQEESSGTYDLRLRLRKSKILCLAGLTPVAKVDHATGDSAGNVVRSR